MQPAWLRWIAYLILAALVTVTSCRAWTGGDAQIPAQVPPAVQAGAQG